MSFFTELHRRNVVRVGIAYTVTAWLLLQVADVVMENIGAPPWVMKALLFLLLLGLLPALLFAWVYELTPEGLKRESEIASGDSVVHQTRRKLDTLIILVLVGVVGFLFWDGKLRGPQPEPDTAQAGSTSVDGQSPGLDRLRDQVEAEAASAARAAAQTRTDKSIAVLPFVNLSSDPEQEYFSDGISEELLNVLAQIPALRVAARTSSFQFKGDNRDISEIAELLKVNHVLEGSVRKAGNRLRITAQLIEADNGFHLWSETYDRELADVFAIQDEISLAIAEALKAELSLNDDGRALVSRETANTPAYEAFLKGRGLINQRGKQAITEGVSELERSIRLDPNFAPARAQLAIGIALLASSSGTYGDLTIEAVNQGAREQIDAAAALDDDFPELWAARSALASVNSESVKALDYAERALVVRPNYADALNWRVNALVELGKYRESFEAREMMLDLDPLSVVGRLNSINWLMWTQPERAMVIAQSIAPQSPWASHVAQSRAYVARQDRARQLEQLLLAYALDAGDLLVNYYLASVFVELGLLDESLRVARDVQPWAKLEAGLFAEAEADFRDALALDPGNIEIITSLASSLYYQERFSEAVELWREAIAPTVHGDLVYSNGGNLPTAQLVFSLRQLGQEEDAAEYLRVLSTHQSAVGDFAERNPNWHVGNAILGMFRGDKETAVESLQRAVTLGLSSPSLLEEPILMPLAEEPAVRVMRETLANRAAQNREKALTLICDNNPVPDHWRPLQATCATRTAEI